MKIGVTAPGSSTNMFVNILLAKAGLKPDAVSIIGVGATAGAVAIMKRGEIDAISNLDPVITHARGRRRRSCRSSTRAPRRACRRSTAAPMPAGCIYAPVDFAKKNPNTAQALVNAMVRALRFIQTSTPDQIVAAVPPEYYTRPRALQGGAREEPRHASSTTARSRIEAGAERATRDLQDVRPDGAERDSRPRQDDQHDVPAEGRAEVQVMPAQRRRRGGSAPALALERHHLHVRRARAAATAATRRSRDTTLAVAPGEFVSVVGPTGCGKSHAAQRRRRACSRRRRGAVRVFGEPLAGINARAGYMFQADALMPWRSALANVIAGLEFRGVARGEARAARARLAARASASPASATAIRTSCRAACASASRWRRC